MNLLQENFKIVDNEGHENPAFENTEKLDISPKSPGIKKDAKNLLDA